MNSECLRCSFNDNSDGYYFVGDTVSGNVEFTLPTEKLVKSIRIYGLGIKEIFLTGEDNKQKEKSTQLSMKYDFRELFKILAHRVECTNTNDSQLRLAKGVHKYPFSFILPTNIPSSFAGKYGYIKYSLLIVLSNEKFESRPFTVHRKLDLNSLPQCRVPINHNDTKDLCCCCFSSGPIILTIKSPKTGYVPGETLAIQISLLNWSRSDIPEIVIILFQTVKFKPYDSIPTGFKEDYISIQQFSIKDIGRRDKKEEELNFIVPKLPPTSPESDPISIVYDLTANVFTSMLSCNMIFQQRLTIGTVALRELPPSLDGTIIEQPLGSLGEFGWNSSLIQSTTASTSTRPSAPLLSDVEAADKKTADTDDTDTAPPSYDALFSIKTKQ